MTKQLEALIADMKAAAELIADGYKSEWKAIHDPDNGVARVGCLDHDGQLSEFVEVSISYYSGNDRHDIELADFYVKANPANVMALIAALEQSQRAERTLESLGYTDNGGQFWKPPIGVKPNFSLMDSYQKLIAELEASQLAVKLPDPLRKSITDDDITALKRFNECCEDPGSGGHDLEKHQVCRLEKIGALQRAGRISYIMDFGYYIISIAAGGTVQRDE